MFRLWRLWKMGGRDLRLLWFALKHPLRPLWLWPVTIALAWFALEPLNFVLPWVGAIDDLIVLPLLLHGVLTLLPSRIRAGFEGKIAIS